MATLPRRRRAARRGDAGAPRRRDPRRGVQRAREPGFSRGFVLAPEQGAAWACVRERRPVASADLLAVPLIVKDVVVGAFAIGDQPGRVFGADEIRVAQAFADHAAIALENAR